MPKIQSSSFDKLRMPFDELRMPFDKLRMTESRNKDSILGTARLVGPFAPRYSVVYSLFCIEFSAYMEVMPREGVPAR